MRIYAFHCGGDRSPQSVYDPLTSDAGEVVYAPYLFFVVDHPAGKVLFDTGLHPKWKTITSDSMLTVEMGDRDDVVSKLALLDVAPDEIEHVVVSHLHFDHAGGLQFFHHASIYVQSEELRFAYWPAVYQREFYDRDDFDHPLKWVEINGTYDLHGDGKIVLIPTPGHTPGHQSLVVELNSGVHILAADASYWSSKMRERKLPGILWSPDAMVASWERLEELERTRGAKLIFTHDVDFREAKPLAPEAWYE
jgi:N-acyl homoserine lactone hydrolase